MPDEKEQPHVCLRSMQSATLEDPSGRIFIARFYAREIGR